MFIKVNEWPGAGTGQSFMNWWTVDPVPGSRTTDIEGRATTASSSADLHLNLTLVNNWPIPRARVMEICHKYNNGTATGNHGGNIKPSSVLALGNRLFAGVQCMTYFDSADPSFLGRQRAWNAWIISSEDEGVSWNVTATPVNFFTGRLTNPMFINAGRGFDGAPDSYIYVHFPAASGPDTAYWGRLDSLFIPLT